MPIEPCAQRILCVSYSKKGGCSDLKTGEDRHPRGMSGRCSSPPDRLCVARSPKAGSGRRPYPHITDVGWRKVCQASSTPATRTVGKITSLTAAQPKSASNWPEP